MGNSDHQVGGKERRARVALVLAVSLLRTERLRGGGVPFWNLTAFGLALKKA